MPSPLARFPLARFPLPRQEAPPTTSRGARRRPQGQDLEALYPPSCTSLMTISTTDAGGPATRAARGAPASCAHEQASLGLLQWADPSLPLARIPNPRRSSLPVRSRSPPCPRRPPAPTDPPSQKRDGRPAQALLASRAPPARADGLARVALALGRARRRRRRRPAVVCDARAVPGAHRGEGASPSSLPSCSSSWTREGADVGASRGQLVSLRARFGEVLADGWGQVLSMEFERESYYAVVDMLLLLRASPPVFCLGCTRKSGEN